MGWPECLRISSDPSHSGGAEQGDDGQGSPMSDRPLLAQPSMVSNSTRVVDSPPKEAPRVGSPPLAPFRESLPQLAFFLQASRLKFFIMKPLTWAGVGELFTTCLIEDFTVTAWILR
jgi:hypothetical protein